MTPLHKPDKVAIVNVLIKLETDHQDLEVQFGDFLARDIEGVVVEPMELAREVLKLMRRVCQLTIKSAPRFQKTLVPIYTNP
jgi:hypothetical protein